MLTDRVATSALVMCLAHFYPKYMFILQVWMMLDISSHWAHTLASAIRGDKSHKSSISDGKRHEFFSKNSVNKVAGVFSSVEGGKGLVFMQQKPLGTCVERS